MWILILYAIIALLHFTVFLYKYSGYDGPIDKDIAVVRVGKIIIALGMSIAWIVLAIANSLLRMKENGDFE